MRWMRVLGLGIAWAGLLLFGAAWLASLVSPGWVEQQGRALLKQQVERRVQQRIDALDDHAVLRLGAKLRTQERQRLQSMQAQLRDGLPARVAQVVAEMSDLDCACRRNIQDWLEGGLRQSLQDATQRENRLTRLIRSQYMETAAQLMREWRIVTGANALVFGLLLGALLWRRQASWHALPAAVLLVAAAALVGWCYLFQQDWLHTLVFSDYVGWAYLGWLGLALAFVSDLALNRARLTVHVVGGALDSLGSSLVVLPC